MKLAQQCGKWGELTKCCVVLTPWTLSRFQWSATGRYNLGKASFFDCILWCVFFFNAKGPVVIPLIKNQELLIFVSLLTSPASWFLGPEPFWPSSNHKSAFSHIFTKDQSLDFNLWCIFLLWVPTCENPWVLKSVGLMAAAAGKRAYAGGGPRRGHE